MFMYSYNQASKSAELLSQTMGVSRIKHRNSAFRGSPDKVVINWGASNPPAEVLHCRVINNWNSIHIAADKLLTFRKLTSEGLGSHIPVFMTSIAEAQSYLSEGRKIVARTQLRGHSGAGIVMMDPEDQSTWDVQAPLYSLYYKKKSEYRVHVVNGEIIDVQRKGLSAEFQGRDDVNWEVRNLANGFIYARNDAVLPEFAGQLAQRAVQALGLDFGAVDMIYTHRNNSFKVLEVNTAPGLMGTTLELYAAAFNRHYGA